VTLADLAPQVEDAQRAVGRLRYGSIFRVGLATVVLNPDSPLVAANFAAGLAGDPDAAVDTLRALPTVFAEAGRTEAVVVDSPSSLPELDLVCDETGYEAVEEGLVLQAFDPGSHPQVVAPVPSGARLAVGLHEGDEVAAAALFADAYGMGSGVGRALVRTLGHRLDDPNTVVTAAYDDQSGRLVGLGLGFVAGDLGLVTELATGLAHRHRGLGATLARALIGELAARGSRRALVTAEAGGRIERFWTGLGFEPAYETTTYVRPIAASSGETAGPG
jgi:GNAT superfamily N-acetyltransferase